MQASSPATLDKRTFVQPGSSGQERCGYPASSACGERSSPTPGTPEHCFRPGSSQSLVSTNNYSSMTALSMRQWLAESGRRTPYTPHVPHRPLSRLMNSPGGVLPAGFHDVVLQQQQSEMYDIRFNYPR